MWLDKYFVSAWKKAKNKIKIKLLILFSIFINVYSFAWLTTLCLATDGFKRNLGIGLAINNTVLTKSKVVIGLLRIFL